MQHTGRKNAIRRTMGDRVFDTANVVFMILFSLMFIYPMLYVLSRSVMPETERAFRPFALIPHSLDFSAYQMLFEPGSSLLSAYRITILRTLVGTAVNLVLTASTAYVLSRKDYPLRGFVTSMMIFTMWFGGGLIPSYLVNRAYGLSNSFWVYIFPGAISAWNTMIMRNFFATIPDSLEESARIDGAHEMRILVAIILPLSKASLATIGLFYAVGHWNSWFDSMLYMTDRSKYTLQYMLRQILSAASSSEMVESESIAYKPPTEMMRMASIIATTVPILFVYPFLQKYFVKGVLVGSLKG